MDCRLYATILTFVRRNFGGFQAQAPTLSKARYALRQILGVPLQSCEVTKTLERLNTTRLSSDDKVLVQLVITGKVKPPG